VDAVTEALEPRTRANYVAAPEYFLLTQACRLVNDAFADGGHGCYLVGSACRTKDYRDVDVRLILEDAYFDALFGTMHALQCNPRWVLLCLAISRHLQQASGLPVDFQIQRMTDANREHSDDERQPLGMFHDMRPHEPYPGGG